jgi:hypothetical protein
VDGFAELVARLQRGGARFVVIGVWGANYYASSGATLFTTLDRDLFLPLDAENLLCAWQVCESMGLRLWADDEPLESPRDLELADRVVGRRALTKATSEQGLQIDLSLVRTGFEFEDVWEQRRVFRVEDTEVPVARLAHIVSSKARTNRPKDRLFLETHAEALARLRDRDG